ncbi:MAG: type II toxin-antitoxin system VapC family toxin [Burkholderiales bacterium]
MMFVLDTNVVSELRRVRHGKADANVAAWADRADAEDLYISVITFHELDIGVLHVERRDARQGVRLRRWLDEQVVPAFEGRILPIDLSVVRRGARLHVPDPRPLRDALIAATALVHGMTVVTRNVTDFRSTGVSILNPWMPVK